MVGLAIDLFCPSPYSLTLILYMIPNFIQGFVDGISASVNIMAAEFGK